MTAVSEVQATTFSHLADAHAPDARETPNGWLTSPDADETRIIVLPNQTLPLYKGEVTDIQRATLSHDAASHSSG